MIRKTTIIPIIFLISSLLSSCNLGTTAVIPQGNKTIAQTLAQIHFQVTLPTPLPAGESVYLVELDEITGLSFNQVRHVMEAEDNRTFFIDLPLPLDSVFKYRYIRVGEYGQQEYAINGQPVRYRVYYAKEPGFVHDIVGQWIDRKTTQATGRLTGKVVDSKTSFPVPNIFVTAGGMVSRTSSTGTFLIQDLPVGIHNLVAYAPDGSYEIFQQEAAIAAETATEAIVAVKPIEFINVTFRVEIPVNTPAGMAMRLVGNLSQLGNTFSELRGGISHTATRLPALTQLSERIYHITLNLPAGSEIRYKYTLGDGIWNAEHDLEGNFVTRRIVLPERNVEIRDLVETWKDSSHESIRFTTQVPALTPPDEIVSIQFNPGYSWLEPVPMTSEGTNLWQFILFSPLKGLETIQYRFCRDVECGNADDNATPGSLVEGRIFDLTTPIISVSDRIDRWHWYDGKPPSAVVPNIDIPLRGDNFIAGIELQAAYHPSWYLRFPSTVKDILDINANWMVMNPTWSYSDNNPPLLEPVTGRDIPGSEVEGLLNYARSRSMQTAVFPISNYPKASSSWWVDSLRDFPWWISWFDRYMEFITHFADIAKQTGASAIILGDQSISPALPNGKLIDNTPSNVPEDASSRWTSIIEKVRERYKGQVWWVLDNRTDPQNLSIILEKVDAFLILVNEPISQNPKAEISELVDGVGKYLDEEILPLQSAYKKPVILAVSYPSALGGSTGCLPGLEEACLDLNLLSRPNPDIPNITLDLRDQENAYNAIFLAVNERPWISGIVSQGFFPPLPLQDKSISVHGKPASGVIWFWFGKFLGK